MFEIFFEGWHKHYFMTISNNGASISETENGKSGWISLPYNQFEQLLRNRVSLKEIKEELINYYKKFYHLD